MLAGDLLPNVHEQTELVSKRDPASRQPTRGVRDGKDGGVNDLFENISNDPRCRHFPLWKLPKDRIESIQSRFRFVVKNCEPICSSDDDYIRPIATRLGICGAEAFPRPDDTGWGFVVLTCDGDYSYAIACYHGYADKSKNGYEMLGLRTELLMKFYKLLGYKEFIKFVESILWIMGFDGAEQIKTMRPWDFAKGN